MNIQKRRTKQKIAIMDYLKSVKTHPTAETVYLELKKEMPKISLGTVYRNLEEFGKAGLVKKFEAGGQKRFDGDISAHCHFICEKCGKIDDLFFGPPRVLKKYLKNYSIGDVNLKIKGRCKKCGQRDK